MAVALLAAVGGFAPQARATVVLDQEQSVAGFVHFLGSGSMVGQTFTVGASGVLDHVDVHLRKTFPTQGPTPNYNIFFSLLAGGSPVGAALATDFVTPAELPDAPATNSDYITFDVSGAGIIVTAGDVFTFVLEGDSVPDATGEWNVFTSDSDVYAGGTKHFFNNVSWVVSDSDLQFRTYVSTGDEPGGPSLPEPGTIALLGLGLAGLGVARRRRAA